jgi:mannosyl-oligosaccharide alpha-1,2-mannosidase
MVWAEGLTCQMEYKYLAHATGRTQFYEKVEDIMTLMHNANVADGLFPTLWDTHSGKPTNGAYHNLYILQQSVLKRTSADLSVGALADSAYEYLLKQYLLTGKSEPKARDLCEFSLSLPSIKSHRPFADLRSVSGIINNLLYLSPTRNLLYVTNIIAGQPTHIQEHLACFLPGLLALGAQSLDTTELSAEDRKLHKWVAEGLANTCWLTYHDSKTGLGPDEVYFSSSGAVKWVDALKTWNGEGVPPGIGDGKQQPANQRDYTLRNSKYLLRPEVCISFLVFSRMHLDVRRPSKAFISCGRQPETRSGEKEVGWCSVLLRERQRLEWGSRS